MRMSEAASPPSTQPLGCWPRSRASEEQSVHLFSPRAAWLDACIHARRRKQGSASRGGLTLFSAVWMPTRQFEQVNSYCDGVPGPVYKVA